MSDFHFIINPVAGNGLSLEAFAKLEALMKERGADYSVAYSEYAGHSPLLAREAVKNNHRCIVAVGGDGTVREVAQTLSGTAIPMCVLPCGTGNDVVRALHIPFEPAAVLELLLSGKPRVVDVGSANGHFFLNVGGFGFDVDVLINTERYKKRHHGLRAYLLGVMRAWFRLRLMRVRVETVDGVREHNALLFAAANGTHFGGGMHVAPRADITDGLLDVCIISDVNRLTVLWALLKFVSGKHLSLSFTTYYQVKEVTVTAIPEAAMQLDGELIGKTPVTFRAVPGALHVLAPPIKP